MVHYTVLPHPTINCVRLDIAKLASYAPRVTALQTCIAMATLIITVIYITD